MKDAAYRFCPLCATALEPAEVAGRARPRCPACGFVQFLDPKVVVVVVVEHGARILLGRRDTEPARGQWSFIGGYVDRGEPVEAAAVREVREESGLDVILTGLLGVFSRPDEAHVVIAYRATVQGGVAGLAAQAGEVAELAFLAPDALPPLAFPNDRAIWDAWQRAASAGRG